MEAKTIGKKERLEAKRIEIAYVDYFVKKHCDRMTMTEIAKTLGVTFARVKYTVKKLDLTARKRFSSDEQCENRPQSCFSCPFPDCRCRCAALETEMEKQFLANAEVKSGCNLTKRAAKRERNLQK